MFKPRKVSELEKDEVPPSFVDEKANSEVRNRKIIRIKRSVTDPAKAENGESNLKIEPSQSVIKNEDESTLEQSKPQPKFEFKCGKLPTSNKEESKEEIK